jgi:hypothetical protein
MDGYRQKVKVIGLMSINDFKSAPEVRPSGIQRGSRVLDLGIYYFKIMLYLDTILIIPISTGNGLLLKNRNGAAITPQISTS